MASGPDAFATQLQEHPELRDYFPFHAARADLLRRAGRLAEAAVEYTRALGLAPSEPEKRYIARRIREAG